jgi:hypothetical protein
MCSPPASASKSPRTAIRWAGRDLLIRRSSSSETYFFAVVEPVADQDEPSLDVLGVPREDEEEDLLDESAERSDFESVELLVCPPLPAR